MAVWQGFFGSLMIFVGSIGAGWIANGSPMFRHPLSSPCAPKVGA
ncbi:conserved hypothetical protein [Arthrobacter sp. Hiyo8]|nr:conserved hypothetical protein [Arthrobacter sp. Hiyo8]